MLSASDEDDDDETAVVDDVLVLIVSERADVVGARVFGGGRCGLFCRYAATGVAGGLCAVGAAVVPVG